MKRYGNICFTRRVVSFVCMLFMAVSVLMPAQLVNADTVSSHVIQYYVNHSDRAPYYDRDLLSINGDYKVVWIRSSDTDHNVYNTFFIIAKKGSINTKSNLFLTNYSTVSGYDIRYFPIGCNYSDYLSNNNKSTACLFYDNGKKVNPTSYYELINQSEIDKVYIDLLDLDHDLGDYAKDGGDGIKLVDWLAETKKFYPIKLHTMNPVGRENMQREIDRYWNKNEK